MKKLQILVVALFATITGFSQSWTLDKSHAKLGFTITHMMISDVEGFLKTFDVKLTSSNPDFSDAAIELTADVNSINTDVEQRDNHLKGPDFFDVSKFPAISFKSKSLTKTGDKTYKLKGELTMHGVTKPVEFDVILKGTVVNPMTKKTIAGFKVSGVLKRTDFGIASTFPAAVLSDEVTITANAEFIKD